METWETIQSILQVLIWFLSVPLVILILLQGSGGDLSSSFGGGGQLDSTLGVGASKKMGKLTGILSFVFLVSVLMINIPSFGDDQIRAVSDPETPVSKPGAGDEPAKPVDKPADAKPADAADKPADAADKPADAADKPADAADKPADAADKPADAADKPADAADKPADAAVEENKPSEAAIELPANGDD